MPLYTVLEDYSTDELWPYIHQFDCKNQIEAYKTWVNHFDDQSKKWIWLKSKLYLKQKAKEWFNILSIDNTINVFIESFVLRRFFLIVNAIKTDSNSSPQFYTLFFMYNWGSFISQFQWKMEDTLIKKVYNGEYNDLIWKENSKKLINIVNKEQRFTKQGKNIWTLSFVFNKKRLNIIIIWTVKNK